MKKGRQLVVIGSIGRCETSRDQEGQVDVSEGTAEVSKYLYLAAGPRAHRGIYAMAPQTNELFASHSTLSASNCKYSVLNIGHYIVSASGGS